ncbi:unnamed protein product [Kuraishia capsulata CBS 1993]|uniref:Vacuolar protein sorting-associated protein 55 n=1 Tax=Kuraishia capsulata CBS 1993 TaxID=1382522 RepID=W6MMT9_9ASCO|nr:uncharacterized protein KUCA_T00002278001 [Kuraishia capsulata CBS 1993]CDK26307.1 unnamed protein product [Kuraishia capsulata CBS 1993]
MSDSPQTNSVAEFAQYTTGFMVLSGLALPLVFYHVALIPLWSFFLCEVGGLIIYTSIVLFGWFFREDASDDYDF